MRKSTQDKVFDQVLKRLPALSNDDLASVAVACQQVAQWRAQGQRNALRIPDSRRTPRDERVASQWVEGDEHKHIASATPGAGDEAIESFTHAEEQGDALQLDTQGQSVAEQAQNEPTPTQEVRV